MNEAPPNLISSDKSNSVTVDGQIFSIQIFRLNKDDDWCLSVEDTDGNSYVWDDTFKSDDDAKSAALAELERRGAVAFKAGGNVLPFRQK